MRRSHAYPGKQPKNVYQSETVEFTCTHCGTEVPVSPIKRHNHCPECHWSIHKLSTDDGEVTFDPCYGQMEPVCVDATGRVEHVCLRCGYKSFSREFPNDTPSQYGKASQANDVS